MHITHVVLIFTVHVKFMAWQGWYYYVFLMPTGRYIIILIIYVPVDKPLNTAGA